MVIVSARGDEYCRHLRIISDNIKTKLSFIKGSRLPKVPNMQMNMSDNGSLRQAFPLRSFAFCEKAFPSNRVASHYIVAARILLPLIPRPIGINLNPVIVRVGNIKRL